jgi:hypothetical protein
MKRTPRLRSARLNCDLARRWHSINKENQSVA